jgi:hypothetical protein
MSWRIKFGEGSLSSLVCDSAALKRFIDDLQLACGAHAAVVKLEEGSIVAHITSPSANFRRVRAAVEARFDSMPVECGGLEATGVELGDWLTINTETWAQLDEERMGRLRDDFNEAGLTHLLAVLLTAPVQEAPLAAHLAEAMIGKADCGQPEGFGGVEGAVSDAIRTTLASGASDEDVYSMAIAAAITAGGDDEAAKAVVDKQLRLAHANKQWEEGQITLEHLRSCNNDFVAAESKDLICPITKEMFIDPVVTTDGMTYERTAIERWFAAGNTTSPETNLPVDPLVLTPDLAMKRRLPVDTYPFKLRLVGGSQDCAQHDMVGLLGEEVLVVLLQQVLPVDVSIVDIKSISCGWTTIFVRIQSIRGMQELRDALFTGKLAQRLTTKLLNSKAAHTMASWLSGAKKDEAALKGRGPAKIQAVAWTCNKCDQYNLALQDQCIECGFE